MFKRICVYCASSNQVHSNFMDAAYKLGEILALNKIEIVYGGGAAGLMGKLAAGALANQGRVIGVIPHFMVELEWANHKSSDLIKVDTMHERKKLMIENTDAVIALPGGTGTFEELFEAITLKRLGFYQNPILIVNTNGYYDPLLTLLDNCIREKFLNPKHKHMWTVVDKPESVLDAILNAEPWPENAHEFAAVRD